MSQTILIESINNPGELANIIFTPFGSEISINIGNVTLPYLFEPGLLTPPQDIYGTYTITTLEDNCVHYSEVVPSTPVVTATPVTTPTITPSISLSKSNTPTPTETVCFTKTPKSTATLTPTNYATPTSSSANQATPTVTKTLTPTPYGVVFSGSEVCDVVIEINDGVRGYYIYDIDLTSLTGRINFNFNAFTIPDRFVIEYPVGTTVYDSGFRGSPIFNQDLNDSGFPDVSGPGVGSGFFNKNTANPTSAKLIVFAPLQNTRWRFLMECPSPFLSSTPATTPIATPSATPYGLVFSGSEFCDVVIEIVDGVRGYYEYVLELGSGTGQVDYRYSAFTIPDRFVIEYPIGNPIRDTQFIGSPTYNQQLNDNGFPDVVGLGYGSNSFNKPTAFPEQAKLIVFAPLSDTRWAFIVDCPSPATSSTPATTPIATPSATPYGLVFSGSEVCDVVIQVIDGVRGYYEYILELGPATGRVNYRYSAFTIPDRFVIEYPIGNQIKDTQFIGSPTYNQQLNDNGFPNVVGLGYGNSFFNKTSTTLNQAKLIVFAPLSDTRWAFIMDCPTPATSATPATTPIATPSATPYGLVFSGSEVCDVVIGITNGVRGYYEYILELTSDIGEVYFRYSAFTIPDRFIIEYPIGNIIKDTEFIGSPTYNQQLNDNGFPDVVDLGYGNGSFSKPTALPDQAKLTVFAPLSDTRWAFIMDCPLPGPTSTPASTPIPTPSATPYGLVFSGNEVCDVVIEVIDGLRGYYEYILDLGVDTGRVNYRYSAYTIPDRFVIEYPIGNIIRDTEFIGSPLYNQQLNDNGFPDVVDLGYGNGFFNKTSAILNQAKLIVFAPLQDTHWAFVMDCPILNITPTPTITKSITPTMSVTKTQFNTKTPTVTETKTPTVTKTLTKTPTPTKSLNATPTPTKSLKATATPSKSFKPGPPLPVPPTPTKTKTSTPTPTVTPTPTITPLGYFSGSENCGGLGVNGGTAGIYEYDIDLGNAVGEVSFDYTAYFVPDRFILQWPIGTVVPGGDTGFRGDPSYNDDLLNYFHPVWCNPNCSPVTGPGPGTLRFNKTSASPNLAKLIVVAPFNGTVWDFGVGCPDPGPDPSSTPEPSKSFTPTKNPTKTPTKTPNTTPSVTPTKTLTKTPTLTRTLTRTPSNTPGLSPSITPSPYCPDCCPVLYIANGVVYQYQISTNTSTQLTVPNIGNFTTDIAHTRNKLWLGGPNGIREWNISFNPFNAVFSRDIPFNFEFGAGLAALDDETLFASPIRDENPARIVRIDLSTTPETVIPFITLNANISFIGDIMVTASGRLIITVTNQSNNLEYVYQYNSGGALEVITQVSGMGFSPNPAALFQEDGVIYIGNYQNGFFYEMGLSTPYPISFVVNSGKVNLAGASSLRECNLVDLTPNISPSPTPTITKTKRTTPTPTRTPGGTVTPTKTLGVTPTPTKTLNVTPTVTKTPGSSPPVTPSQTRTPNSSPGPTRTSTPTITITPTNTKTPGTSPDPTPSKTPTKTPTNTKTPTQTAEPVICNCFEFTSASLGYVDYFDCNGNSGSQLVQDGAPVKTCVRDNDFTLFFDVVATFIDLCVGGLCPAVQPTPTPTITITPTVTRTGITPTPTSTTTLTQTPTNTNTQTPTRTPDPQNPTVNPCEPIFVNSSSPYGIYLENAVEITPPVGWDSSRPTTDISHSWDSSSSVGYIHIAYNTYTPPAGPSQSAKIREWKITSLSPLTYDTSYNGVGYKDYPYPTLPTTITALGNGLCEKDNSGDYILSTALISGIRYVIEIDLSVSPPIYTQVLSLGSPVNDLTGDLIYTDSGKIILTLTQLGVPITYYINQYVYSNNTPEVTIPYDGISPPPLVGLWEDSSIIYAVSINGEKWEIPNTSPYTPVYISTLPIPGGVSGASQIPGCLPTDLIP